MREEAASLKSVLVAGPAHGERHQVSVKRGVGGLDPDASVNRAVHNVVLNDDTVSVDNTDSRVKAVSE